MQAAVSLSLIDLLDLIDLIDILNLIDRFSRQSTASTSNRPSRLSRQSKQSRQSKAEHCRVKLIAECDLGKKMGCNLSHSPKTFNEGTYFLCEWHCPAIGQQPHLWPQLFLPALRSLMILLTIRAIIPARTISTTAVPISVLL
jgi:hypothetical protein